jgi:DNA mismatch repair protein MSH5
MSSRSKVDGKYLRFEKLLAILKSCRHMLQEMTVPSYVPNDTSLVGGSEDSDTNGASTCKDHDPSMLILTGPNYSGKSVYMKQVSKFLS